MAQLVACSALKPMSCNSSIVKDAILCCAWSLPRPHFIVCPNSAGVIPWGRFSRIRSATSSIELGASNMCHHFRPRRERLYPPFLKLHIETQPTNFVGEHVETGR